MGTPSGEEMGAPSGGALSGKEVSGSSGSSGRSGSGKCTLRTHKILG